MSVVSRTRWLRRFGMAAVASVGLCAVALPLTSQPAEAGISVTLGAPGWGYYAPPPAPYYYPAYRRYYPAHVYFHHPYYHHHYWHHPYYHRYGWR